mmetsp:Transcript_10111/g.18948  ORF Transcript_10111/g.18948 Transcript_10111/m.18948 type:complete len:163 (+) Transcript_10111:60-548(+)
MAEMQQECTEEAQPTTAIVVLGEAMIFKPQAHVISITLLYREQFREALEHMAEPDSLEIMHIVVKSNDLNDLYDPDAIIEFVPCLKDGAEMIVHVLVGENQTSSDEDGEVVRMSLVGAGLRLQSEVMGEDGSRMLTATKPGGLDDVEEGEEEEEEGDDDRNE